MADTNSNANTSFRAASKRSSKASRSGSLHATAHVKPLPVGTPAHAPKRAAHKPLAMSALPASRGPDSVLAFRRELADHERAVIDAAFTILGCYLREPGGAFTTPDAITQYLRLHLAGEQCELFAVLYLDSQHRAISLETPFAGTVHQTPVYPREIVRAALAYGASYVVLAHNHPNGEPIPSASDVAITQTLKAALALVDVMVLDHFIIAGNQIASMAEIGLM